MKYNSKNRKEIANRYGVVTTIDRIKATIQVSSKAGGIRLTEGYKYLPCVHRSKKLDYAYYAIYQNRLGETKAVFRSSFPLSDSKDMIKEKIAKLTPSPKKIKHKGRVYYLMSHETYPTTEYDIAVVSHNAKVTKSKSYLNIELNDVLQEHDHIPITLLRDVVIELIEKGVIEYKGKINSGQQVRRKANTILKQMSISEVEIASDFAPPYGNALFEGLIKNGDEKIRQYENTIYYETSYKKSHRWKWKLYNRSYKDRCDGAGKQRALPPNANDIFRFEITLGTKIMGNRNKRIEILNHKSSVIIQKLAELTQQSYVQFVGRQDPKLIVQLIEDAKTRFCIGEKFPKTKRGEKAKALRKVLHNYSSVYPFFPRQMFIPIMMSSSEIPFEKEKPAVFWDTEKTFLANEPFHFEGPDSTFRQLISDNSNSRFPVH